jgi:hypothetical protein
MSKKKAKKKTKIEFMLDLETYDFLREVSKLSGVTRDDVINVVLATSLIREKRKDERQKKI